MNEEYKKMIGSHIAKEKTFFKTLSAPSTLPLIEGGCPIQIFTGSNRSWALPQSDPQDVRETRTWVEEKGVTLFIHSIYLINLSRCGPDFSKARDRLIHDLVLGPQLGAKGVVVHVGKALQMGQPQAILNMYNNLVGLLDHIDPSCPLLVETPAGQGTEILVSLDSFKKFYARFTPQQREKIKVCIDTCHVWAAGHEPLEYLEGWTQTFPGSSNSEGVGADRTPSGVRYRSVEDGQGASSTRVASHWSIIMIPRHPRVQEGTAMRYRVRAILEKKRWTVLWSGVPLRRSQWLWNKCIKNHTEARHEGWLYEECKERLKNLNKRVYSK